MIPVSKYFTLSALCAVSFSCAPSHAQQEEEIVKLTNGAYAHKARVEEVCKALPMLDKKSEVRDLYFSCWKCQQKDRAHCNLRVPEIFKGRKVFSEKSIEKFDSLKITTNGVVDQETQHIIAAVGTVSFHDWGNLDPIAKPWHESVPVLGKAWNAYMKWLTKSLKKPSDQ